MSNIHQLRDVIPERLENYIPWLWQLVLEKEHLRIRNDILRLRCIGLRNDILRLGKGEYPIETCIRPSSVKNI